MENQDHMQQANHDHDLLVRVDEKLNGVMGDIKDIKDDLGKRVTVLELDKLGKEDYNKMVNKYEAERKQLSDDIESLKTWKWIITGGLIVISSIDIPMAVYIFKTQTNQREQSRLGTLDALATFNIKPNE